MTDHSLPEPEPGLLAASAHFDGVADADERALVDGSEPLQGLVAAFGEVKAALNDLPPVPEAELEHTLAAALAEFDTLAAGPAAAAAFSATATPPTPVRTDRARWTRVLAVAAAAVILGVVGVAIAKKGDDNSAHSSAGEKAFDAPSTLAAASGGAASATGTDAGGISASSTIGAINSSADALPSYDQEADLRTLPGTEADIQAPPESGAPAVPVANSGTPGSNGQPLNGPLVFPFTCPLTAQQVFIAEINWKGAPAAAVRDTVSGITQAIDPQCNVLVSVQP